MLPHKPACLRPGLQIVVRNQLLSERRLSTSGFSGLQSHASPQHNSTQPPPTHSHPTTDSCLSSLSFICFQKEKKCAKSLKTIVDRDLQATHRDCYAADRNQHGRVSGLIKHMWQFEKLQSALWTMKWSKMKKKKMCIKDVKGARLLIIRKTITGAILTILTAGFEGIQAPWVFSSPQQVPRSWKGLKRKLPEAQVAGMLLSAVALDGPLICILCSGKF